MRRFTYVCLSFTAAAALLSASQQPASPDPAKKTRLLGSSPEPMMPMPLVAPLFIEDNSTESIITMASHSTMPLDVDVTLSALSGDQLVTKTITIAAHSEQTLNIADLLANAPAASASTYGSVLLVPHRAAALAAQLSIVSRTGSPQDIEEEFAMPMSSKPASYRAVTSGLSAMPVIAIRSVSKAQQTVSISCVMEAGGARSSSMPIAPNQTLLMQVCQDRGPKPMANLEGALDAARDPKQAFAISVSSSAPSMELAVFGLGAHGTEADHSFSSIPFWDVNMSMSSTAIYPAVPPAQSTTFGPQSFQLRASAANFSNAPRKATILLTTGSGANSTQQTVASLTLAPNSVSAADLPEIAGEPIPTHSLIIQAEGQPGDVLTDVQAVSTSNGVPVSVTLPGKDLNQKDNSGEHPWLVSDSVSSTVLLFNPDPELKNSGVQLTIYAGQAVWTKKLLLAPSATMAISLNEIIQKQQPDDKGKVLPPSSSHGLVTWSSLSKPRVFGKLVQLDEGTDIARTFACEYMSIMCNVDVPYLTVGFGQEAPWGPDSVQACDSTGGCSCSDNCDQGFSGYEESSYWQMANSSIASIDSNADVWGNGVGTTSGYVTITDNTGCQASGGNQVMVNPAIFLNGTDVTGQTVTAIIGEPITLQAQYTVPSGYSVQNQSWSISGGNVVGGYNADSISSSYTSVDTSQQQVTYYNLVPASQGVTYSVTLSDGNTYTGSVSMTVVAPTGNIVSYTQWVSVDQNWAVSPGDWSLYFGQGTHYGIVWTSSVTVPQGFSLGDLQFVQIVKSLYIERQTIAGNWYHISSSSPVLDTDYPYNNTVTDQDGDAPGLILTTAGGYQYYYRVDQFTTYAMWKPTYPNAIWVPVAAVDWNWGGGAMLQSDNPPAWIETTASWSTNPASRSYYGPLTWDGNIANLLVWQPGQ